MRPLKSLRCIPRSRAATGPRRWPLLPALLLLCGCELTEVQTEPVPDLIVAGVTVVLTVDPLDPSRMDTRANALITRFHRQTEHEVPGASVRIVAESGRMLQLTEVSDPLATCVTRLDEGIRPPAGSCHLAAAPAAHFAPGEKLTLSVTLPDGSVLTGESRMPGIFTPTNLSLEDGRCRLDPDTGYRFDWARSEGSWGYIAEARFAGLGDLWDSEAPLSLAVTLRGAHETGVLFPRDLLFEALDPNRTDLHSVLRQGLPEGASAQVAVGAIDRNWANWVRLGRIDIPGEVHIPSVFGDGTGWFGTGVRWKVSVESRAAGDEGVANELPSCGAASG